MSVSQFDDLLAILEPHIKKKTTNFCEVSVQGSIYSRAAQLIEFLIAITIMDATIT